MRIRAALLSALVIGSFAAARAQDHRIEEATAAQNWDVAQIKPGTIVFSDRGADAKADTKTVGDASLMPFSEWAKARPRQKQFLSLFASYSEPTVAAGSADKGPVTQRLYMYVAQARFILDRAPGSIDLAQYVTLPFLQRVDPAIKHKAIAAADLPALKDHQGAGNVNPTRPWCTGRPTLVCIQSSYALEGKIPLGIMLVNRLRDSAKKISDHIDFYSELSELPPADIDQAALAQLTGLATPVTAVLEQNIFHVNQIMKFGKFFGVFQDYPNDANKTVVTAYMALAINAETLEKKRQYEHVPVLRNLVPEQVLMGKSSFNSGQSISAGLPRYARNEITTIADILAKDAPAK